MTGMDFLAAIRRDADRFHEVAAAADPTAAVPSCPGWTVADLVWHLGEVHWFWATDVEQRASDPDDVEAAKPERPTGYPELATWARAQSERLVRVLDETPDDVRVWTWALEESDQNVAFVRRHQVQETAVHRWDIEAATGAPSAPIEPELASDCVDEVLSITLPWGVRADKPLPGSVHLHCTDTDGEWFVHADGRVERVHQKGDVAIRGAAWDLILALYSRVSLAELDVIGDEPLARELLTRINTE